MQHHAEDCSARLPSPTFTLALVITKTAGIRMRKHGSAGVRAWYAQLVHIALDFDDTLWPLHEFLAGLPGAEHVRLEECTAYESIVMQLGGRDAFEHFHRQALSYELMSMMPFLEGAVESLAALGADGVGFTVITAREDEALHAVERYLTEHGVAPARTVSCQSPSKPDWCLENEMALLVDDHPQTIALAAEKGLPVIARLAPWNQEVVRRLDVPHAGDWTGLEQLIRAELGI